MPFASVFTKELDRTPAEVAKLTGTKGRAFPLISTTLAVIVEDPPPAEIVLGFAVSEMRPTAAVPTAILTAPFAPVFAPPDEAVIVAVPFAPPALNFTTTRPLTSVTGSAG